MRPHRVAAVFVDRALARLCRTLPALFAALLLGPIMTSPAPAVAASADFNFNWTGKPAVPQPWVPGAVNDWDLIETNDQPTDNLAGHFKPMPAAHGSDCSAPPAVHPINSFNPDAAYICNNHMMTSASDSEVFFSPARMVDFSNGTAKVTWQVSTSRTSDRDWWDVWLSPFSENRVVPTADQPAFNGPPQDAVHVIMTGQDGCSPHQAYGPRAGTAFMYDIYQGGAKVQQGGSGACMENALPGGISAKVRATFELDISRTHVKFHMPDGTPDVVWVDANTNLSFDRAVIVWGHHSYDPGKTCGYSGICGPNTWHWSNVSISPAIPFTMLRPNGVASVHNGVQTTVTLPQAAPSNAFLRFAAIGHIQISLDGGPFQPPRLQGDGPGPGTTNSYFTPIPAGTRTIKFTGSGPTGSSWPWWVEDVSVWSTEVPSSVGGSQPSPVAEVPQATPNSQTGSSTTSVAPSALPGPPKTGLSLLTGLGHRIRGLNLAVVGPVGGIGGLLAIAGGLTLWRRRRSGKTGTTAPSE
jgi:hypothetical protein